MPRSHARRVLARFAACGLLAPLAIPRPMNAQASIEMRTPEAAARAFFAAVEGRRWSDAARLVHPAAMRRHQEHTLASLRAFAQAPRRPSLTPEDMLRHDPQMPRVVAEYQARRANEHRQEYERRELERTGVASLEELERLPPEEAFTRVLVASDERDPMQRELERQAGPETGELLARTMPRTTRRVIGSVTPPSEPAGAAGGLAGDFAYVLYEVAYRTRGEPGTGPERVAVVSARRDGDAWKLDPGEFGVHELFGGGNFSMSIAHVEGSAGDVAEAARQAVVWPQSGAPRLRVRMAGGGADPLKAPPTTLVLERLAADGTVAARVEVPAEAWAQLSEVVMLWAMLIPEPDEPSP